MKYNTLNRFIQGDILDNGNKEILIDKDDLESILQKVKELGCDTPFYIRQKDENEGDVSFEIEVPFKLKGIFGFFTFRV
jgi:hypothetical protein